MAKKNYSARKTADTTSELTTSGSNKSTKSSKNKSYSRSATTGNNKTLRSNRTVKGGMTSNASGINVSDITFTPASSLDIAYKQSVGTGQWSANYRAGFDNGITTWSRFNLVASQPQYVPIEVQAKPAATCTPSGAVLWTHHTFGPNPWINTLSSAINQSAFKVKQFIDMQLGPKTTYGPQDIAVYIMALSDILEKVAEIKRAICLTNTEATYPGFFPHGVLDLLGIVKEPSSSKGSYVYNTEQGQSAQVIAGQTNVYADELNIIINQINSLPMPAEVPILQANADMYSVIYADSADIDSAQLYMFASRGYWVYDEESVENSVNLVYKTWGGSSPHGQKGTKYKSIRSMINALKTMTYNAINMSESKSMIQDLYNAYGTGNLLRIDYLSAESVVPIVHDEDMLYSIENAAIINGVTMFDMVANANDNLVHGEPGIPFTADVFPSAVNLPLQFHCKPEDVTTEMVARALRFHPVFGTISQTAGQVAGEAVTGQYATAAGKLGFAIIDSMDISLRDQSSNYSADGRVYPYFYTININTRGLSISSLETMNVLQDFFRAPMLVDCSTVTSTAEDGKTVTGYSVTINSYTGQRDIEITVNNQYLEQWFRGICEVAWASGIQRPTRGQRSIIG